MGNSFVCAAALGREIARGPGVGCSGLFDALRSTWDVGDDAVVGARAVTRFVGGGVVRVTSTGRPGVTTSDVAYSVDAVRLGRIDAIANHTGRRIDHMKGRDRRSLDRVTAGQNDPDRMTRRGTDNTRLSKTLLAQRPEEIAIIESGSPRGHWINGRANVALVVHGTETEKVVVL